MWTEEDSTRSGLPAYNTYGPRRRQYEPRESLFFFGFPATSLCIIIIIISDFPSVPENDRSYLSDPTAPLRKRFFFSYPPPAPATRFLSKKILLLYIYIYTVFNLLSPTRPFVITAAPCCAPSPRNIISRALTPDVRLSYCYYYVREDPGRAQPVADRKTHLSPTREKKKKKIPPVPDPIDLLAVLARSGPYPCNRTRYFLLFNSHHYSCSIWSRWKTIDRPDTDRRIYSLQVSICGPVVTPTSISRPLVQSRRRVI